MNKYLEITEKFIEEVFNLNDIFKHFSYSFYDSLIKIEQRKGEFKKLQFNNIFSNLKITFGNAGFESYNESFLMSLVLIR